MTETQDKTTELRLQVLNNGYVPLPNNKKACFVKGWPSLKVDEERVRSWQTEEPRAKDTGLRCSTIVAIDRDIEEPELMKRFDAVLRAMTAEAGWEGWLEVEGNLPKDKWIFAMAEEKVTSATSTRWIQATPEAIEAWKEDPEKEMPGPSAMVEILGLGRQIGAFGTCKAERKPVEGGFVLYKNEYHWRGKSPADTPVSELPTLSRQEAEAVLRLFDEFMEDQPGWHRAVRQQHSYGDRPVKYDLEIDTVIEGAEGSWTVGELKAMGEARIRLTLHGKDRKNAEIYVEHGEVTFVEYLEPGCVHKEPLYVDDEEVFHRIGRELEVLQADKTKAIDPTIDGQELHTSARMLLDRKLTTKGTLMSSQPTTAKNVAALLGENHLVPTRQLYTATADIVATGRPWATDISLELKELAIIDAAARLGMNDRGAVRDVVEAMASSNLYSPVEAWLLEQPAWDGKERMEALFDRITLQYPEDDKLAWNVFWTWLEQAYVAATGWRNPCEVGYVLTLIGPQGVGKSRFGRYLVPERLGMYREGVTLALDGFKSEERDAMLEALGQWITELAELPATKKRSSSNAVKAMLTRRYDVYRKAYARHEVKMPRATVFIATSNEPEVLKDATGSRRFWPIQVKKIEDVSTFEPEGGLEYWQGQLWQEVAVRVRSAQSIGKPFNFLPSDMEAELARISDERFTEHPPVIDALQQGLDEKASVALHSKGAYSDNWKQFLTLTQILEGIGYVSSGSFGTMGDRREASQWLTRHLGPRVPRMTKGDRRKRVWGVVFNRR